MAFWGKDKYLCENILFMILYKKLDSEGKRAIIMHLIFVSEG